MNFEITFMIHLCVLEISHPSGNNAHCVSGEAHRFLRLFDTKLNNKNISPHFRNF